MIDPLCKSRLLHCVLFPRAPPYDSTLDARPPLHALLFRVSFVECACTVACRPWRRFLEGSASTAGTVPFSSDTSPSRQIHAHVTRAPAVALHRSHRVASGSGAPPSHGPCPWRTPTSRALPPAPTAHDPEGLRRPPMPHSIVWLSKSWGPVVGVVVRNPVCFRCARVHHRFQTVQRGWMDGQSLGSETELVSEALRAEVMAYKRNTSEL